MEAVWPKLQLTVQIATKLNRSHVVHGEIASLLRCLGRIEIHEQESGPQAVSIEISIGHFQGSRGWVAILSSIKSSASLRRSPRDIFFPMSRVWIVLYGALRLERPGADQAFPGSDRDHG